MPFEAKPGLLNSKLCICCDLLYIFITFWSLINESLKNTQRSTRCVASVGGISVWPWIESWKKNYLSFFLILSRSVDSSLSLDKTFNCFKICISHPRVSYCLNSKRDKMWKTVLKDAIHVSLILILPILQLIQEDVLDAGNDKNEKEEVIKRKIPYILKRQLYENKPRRPYILKRGSYYYWEDKYFIYLWLWFIIL